MLGLATRHLGDFHPLMIGNHLAIILEREAISDPEGSEFFRRVSLTLGSSIIWRCYSNCNTKNFDNILIKMCSMLFVPLYG